MLTGTTNRTCIIYQYQKTNLIISKIITFTQTIILNFVFIYVQFC